MHVYVPIAACITSTCLVIFWKSRKRDPFSGPPIPKMKKLRASAVKAIRLMGAPSESLDFLAGPPFTPSDLYDWWWNSMRMAQIVSLYRETAATTLDPELIAEFNDYHAAFNSLHATTTKALCRALCEYAAGKVLRQSGRYYGSVVAITYGQLVMSLQGMAYLVDRGRYGFMEDDS